MPLNTQLSEQNKTKQKRTIEEIKNDMKSLLSTYDARYASGQGDGYLHMFSGYLGGYTANQKKLVVEKIISKEKLSEKEEKIADQGRLKKLVCELRDAQKNPQEQKQEQEPNRNERGSSLT